MIDYKKKFDGSLWVRAWWVKEKGVWFVSFGWGHDGL